MSHQSLNRGGFPSSRNKGRPYRPPRLITKKDGTQEYHPLDMMRMGKVDPKTGLAKRINSTGCFGTMKTFGGPRITLYVKKGLPGRDRAPKRHKRTCKLFCGNAAFSFEKGSFEQLKNLRAKILTVKIMGDFLHRNFLTKEINQILIGITNFLFERFPDKRNELLQADLARKDTVMGMVKNGNVQVQAIRSLDQKIRKAALYIRSSEGRREERKVT